MAATGNELVTLEQMNNLFTLNSIIGSLYWRNGVSTKDSVIARAIPIVKFDKDSMLILFYHRIYTDTDGQLRLMPQENNAWKITGIRDPANANTLTIYLPASTYQRGTTQDTLVQAAKFSFSSSEDIILDTKAVDKSINASLWGYHVLPVIYEMK